MQLYGRRNSINVAPVLWCMEELGLRYERRDVGGSFGGLDAEFRALNPNSRIPVLDDGGFVLWESNAIIRYLADTYGRESLRSGDNRERARNDQWMEWYKTTLYPPFVALYQQFIRVEPTARDTQRMDELAQTVADLLRVPDDELQRHPHLGGDRSAWVIFRSESRSTATSRCRSRGRSWKASSAGMRASVPARPIRPASCGRLGLRPVNSSHWSKPTHEPEGARDVCQDNDDYHYMIVILHILTNGESRGICVVKEGILMTGEPSSTRPDGSQSIVRAVELLSHVATCAESGARLSQVAELSGLHIATARRILQTLVSEGLLAFDSKSKLYTVGPAIYSFAVKGHALFSRRELFMPALGAIARRTQDTVMFSVRSGAESVCLVRREGAFPIRVMSLAEGSRRPLGAGSGSLAILAFLGGEDRAELLKRCAPLYEQYRLSAAVVAKDLAEARKAGFSFNPGRIIDGVYGIGVPILKDGIAVASVSVASIANRMTPARRQEIVSVIREELSALPGYELPERSAALTRTKGVA